MASAQQENYNIMHGKVSFTFDDGFESALKVVYPIFSSHSVPASLGIISKSSALSDSELLMLQEKGWEIICHSCSHIKLTADVPEETVRKEIIDSKKELEKRGFRIRLFLSPCSFTDPKWQHYLRENYDGAFTVYTSAKTEPIEKMVIKRPFLRYEMNRCCTSGKTLDELKAYIDYVYENNSYLAFYEHDIGVKSNITADALEELVDYTLKKGVRIVNPSDAIDEEMCLTHRIRSGYDGKKCFVHARMTSEPDGSVLATAQYLDVSGSDLFSPLMFARSKNGGMTFEDFGERDGFCGAFPEGDLLYCGCDFTPFYHALTGRTVITGHVAAYRANEKVPVRAKQFVPYMVSDPLNNSVSEMKYIDIHETPDFNRIGSGCSQTVVLENGDILIPVSHNAEGHGVKSLEAVIRCSFDGEKLTFIERGNSLSADEEARGLGEGSLAMLDGKFYLTLRSDGHGYVARSNDGLHFEEPVLWRTSDGEILPTYNTQSHWFMLGSQLWLVYTRKVGFNDHVFRHRAPLFAAPFDPQTMTLDNSREIVVVPERGARLGNFSAGNFDENTAYVMAAEWMQPEGCEKYGSDNSIYLTVIRNII